MTASPDSPANKPLVTIEVYTYGVAIVVDGEILGGVSGLEMYPIGHMDTVTHTRMGRIGRITLCPNSFSHCISEDYRAKMRVMIGKAVEAGFEIVIERGLMDGSLMAGCVG